MIARTDDRKALRYRHAGQRMEITIPRSVPFQHSYVSKWLQLRNAFSVRVSASKSDRSAIYVKVWGGLGRGGAKLGQLLAISRKAREVRTRRDYHFASAIRITAVTSKSCRFRLLLTLAILSLPVCARAVRDCW